MLSNKGDNERRIKCPYDESHQILHYRFQTHLVKCKRNYPDVKLVDCMYNSVHQIPEPELLYHQENCVDRIGLDKFMYVSETVDKNKFPIPQLNLKAEEDWDDECTETYNPEEYCRNNPVLRNQCTLSAAKRRNFRMEERQRIQQFENPSKSEEPQRAEPEIVQRERQPETPRRPIGRSAALPHNKAPPTIANLLEKVKLGANTATIPKLVGSSSVTDRVNGTPPNDDLGEDYPPLGGRRRKNEGPTDAPVEVWTAVSLAKEWNGITASNQSLPQGRGRGSSLAQRK